MAKRSTRKKLDYQVFLSYSRQDTWIAHVMREKIEARGIKVWLDVIDLPAGANVRERIKEGMRASTEALILLSPASRNSDWVKHELGIADGMDKWTTLILFHVASDDVPEPVSHLNYLSINDFDSYLEQLVGRREALARGE
jgi:hypothetical protein